MTVSRMRGLGVATVVAACSFASLATTACCRSIADTSKPWVSGSASADDGWSTPARPTSIASPVGNQPTWSDSIVTRSAQPAYRSPPPPPPPGGAPTVVVPMAGGPVPCPPPAAVVAPAAAPMAAPMAGPAPAPAPLLERAWPGCGLPCEYGISMWHVRAVGGFAWFTGDDPGEGCMYWGADIGRTFCGCWGLDAFYRYNPVKFDRLVGPAGGMDQDGGVIHHVGVKLTYEKSIANSKFYVWGGIGPEFWWTQDLLDDDSGFGAFGEIGLGYILNRTFRIRGGLNAHWMPDIAAGRFNPADDGEGRALWVFAPVLELEVDF
jgi:hypothetical protein